MMLEQPKFYPGDKVWVVRYGECGYIVEPRAGVKWRDND